MIISIRQALNTYRTSAQYSKPQAGEHISSFRPFKSECRPPSTVIINLNVPPSLDLLQKVCDSSSGGCGAETRASCGDRRLNNVLADNGPFKYDKLVRTLTSDSLGSSINIVGVYDMAFRTVFTFSLSTQCYNASHTNEIFEIMYSRERLRKD